MKNLVSIIDNQVVTDSLKVAECFEKRHCDVVRRLESLETPGNFNQRNFALVKYKDKKGEQRPFYNITKDGFVLLAMGFTGQKALEFKLAYITAFNAMESKLKTVKKQYNTELVSQAFNQSLDRIKAEKRREYKDYKLSKFEAEIIENMRSANAFDMLKLYMGVDKKLKA